MPTAVASPPSKYTVAVCVPGTPRKAFSTAALQWPHVMPLTRTLAATAGPAGAAPASSPVGSIRAAVLGTVGVAVDASATAAIIRSTCASIH